MKIDQNINPEAAFEELSNRIRQYRIAFPMTQEELADRAMVSVGTLRRFEKGEDISGVKLIRILYAMGLSGGLNTLIADPDERPSYHLGNQKKRIRAGRKKTKPGNVWKWGEDA